MEKINRYVQLVISIVLIAFGLFGLFTIINGNIRQFGIGIMFILVGLDFNPYVIDYMNKKLADSITIPKRMIFAIWVIVMYMFLLTLGKQSSWELFFNGILLKLRYCNKKIQNK